MKLFHGNDKCTISNLWWPCNPITARRAAVLTRSGDNDRRSYWRNDFSNDNDSVSKWLTYVLRHGASEVPPSDWGGCIKAMHHVLGISEGVSVRKRSTWINMASSPWTSWLRWGKRRVAKRRALPKQTRWVQFHLSQFWLFLVQNAAYLKLRYPVSSARSTPLITVNWPVSHHVKWSSLQIRYLLFGSPLYSDSSDGVLSCFYLFYYSIIVNIVNHPIENYWTTFLQYMTFFVYMQYFDAYWYVRNKLVPDDTFFPTPWGSLHSVSLL